MRASSPSILTSALASWLGRWSAILPVLVAELVVLVGFGAVLPILPLYMVRTGIEPGLLGVIIAAWPIAKLVSEPVFGYLADRHARRPLMLAALGILAVAMLMPIWLTSATAFFLSRLLGGVATGIYDPAARGIIFDATPEGRRGEAFGLYGSFQMGGLIIGPVIGAAGAAVTGGFGFPFGLMAGLTIVSAIYLATTLPAIDRRRRSDPVLAPPDPPGEAARPTSHLGPGGEEIGSGLVGEAALQAGRHHAATPRRGAALLNRLLLAAVVMELGFSFAAGVYEVIWSLYMERLGASLEWIGLTFTIFAVPIMFLSPVAGRLVDTFGGLRFAVGGGLAVATAGLMYTFATEPLAPALIGVLEACGFAFVTPALFWLLARGTPAGRTSTAQGIFGASGTVGTIVSALPAGLLWSVDPRLPFYFLVAAALVGIALAVLALAGQPGSARAERVSPA